MNVNYTPELPTALAHIGVNIVSAERVWGTIGQNKDETIRVTMRSQCKGLFRRHIFVELERTAISMYFDEPGKVGF